MYLFMLPLYWFLGIIMCIYIYLYVSLYATSYHASMLFTYYLLYSFAPYFRAAACAP